MVDPPIPEFSAPLRVFVSYSGTTSRRLAEHLVAFIEKVLSASPWIEIEAGNRWFGILTERLGEAVFGILCLTTENLTSPWLHFEAGALSRDAVVPVVPFLFNLQPKDVKGPLEQFQTVHYDDCKGVRLLIHSIARSCRVPSDTTEINKRFDSYWNSFYDQLSILRSAFGTMLSPDRPCYIVCSSHPTRSLRDQASKVRRLFGGRTIRVVTFSDMQGVNHIASILAVHGKDKSSIKYFTSDQTLPLAERRSVVLIGGPNSNRLTDQALLLAGSPASFYLNSIQLSTGRSAVRQWNRDYGIIALFEHGWTLYLVLAGIGSRGTLGTCRFFSQEASEGRLPSTDFFGLVEVDTAPGFESEHLNGEYIKLK
ncbi:MAG: toll/interleukin-1 receptor domain-containing protein [Actinomycetota bacterium]|nr:toll/interleukin-1 receptor domain-containing protein [Actinomycetota bacterium]